MIIKKFNDFITESYLDGGRQPLYHNTRNITAILSSDNLRMTTTSYPKDIKAICLTRSEYYTKEGEFSSEIRIKLDTDKLTKDGYIPYPVDEIGMLVTSLGLSQSFIKSNFDEVKKGKRGTYHNLDIPNRYELETEFEERIYKDIPNIGKYIINIELPNTVKIVAMDFLNINKYLQKYPNIKIMTFDIIKRNKLKDITNDFIKNNYTEKV